MCYIVVISSDSVVKIMFGNKLIDLDKQLD